MVDGRVPVLIGIYGSVETVSPVYANDLVRLHME